VLRRATRPTLFPYTTLFRSETDSRSQAFSLPRYAAFINRATLPRPSLPVTAPNGAWAGLFSRVNIDDVRFSENRIDARTGTATDHDELAIRSRRNRAVARRRHGGSLAPCTACKIKHEMIAKGARRTAKLSACHMDAPVHQRCHMAGARLRKRGTNLPAACCRIKNINPACRVSVHQTADHIDATIHRHIGSGN